LGAGNGTDWFPVERAVACFWDSHVCGVIESIAKRSDPDRWKPQGYSYFEKPIWSMLESRKAARRADAFRLPDSPHVRGIYTAITGFVLADFNHKELKLIYEISTHVGDIGGLSGPIRAARERGNRNIYYLHGIVSRDARQRDGRIAEVHAEAARQNAGTNTIRTVAPILGQVERALVKHDWEEKLQNRELELAMERYAKDKGPKSRS
jgi:hypothetical protein